MTAAIKAALDTYQSLMLPAHESVRKAHDRLIDDARAELAAIEAKLEQQGKALDNLLSHVNDKYQFCGDDPMPVASRTWRECVDALRAARGQS